MKKLMPLWIVDPVSAEKELDRLALQGQKLTDMGFFGNCTFTESVPRQVHHRIVLEKGGVKKGTAARGWEALCEKKLFYVACNENEDETIGYSSHKKLHTAAKFVCFLLVCMFIGFFSGMMMARIDKEADTLLVMPDAAIAAVLLAGVAALWIAFARGGKKMPGQTTKMGGYMKTIPEENFIYDKATEKQMIKNKTMKTVTKPGWFYAPDKAEEWVEDMARQGWAFYRFDPMGVKFFFIREDKPAKLKFVMDYQNIADDEYYQMMKDEGWKLEFTSLSRMMGFSIWTKRWDDEDEAPSFYSDIETEYARAKRFALTFGISLGAMIPVFIAIVAMYIKNRATDDSLPALLYFIAIYSVVTVEYAIFFIKVIAYFFRVRKRR